MKKKNFTLLNYSAIAAAFISISEGVPDPNIVYVDIDPDITLHTGESVSLDFNDDGIDDVFFKAEYYHAAVGWTSFFSVNLILGIPRNDNMVPGNNITGLDSHYFSSTFYWNSYVEAKNLNLGENIDTALSWKDIINSSTTWHDRYAGQAAFGLINQVTTSSGATAGSDIRGLFLGDDEGFAAFKFKIDGNYHYGWVRLEVNKKSTKIVIKDYGYNSLPGASILAGNTGLDCASPSIENSNIISPAAARANFTSVLGATAYQVKYRKVGSPAWSIKNVSAPKSNAILSGLDCNTNYEWKVRANCGVTFSTFSNIATFTTLSCREGETIQLKSVDIFPNPVSETLSVDLSVFSENKIVAELYDLQGNIVLQNIYSNNISHISVNGIANGVYILKLSSMAEVFNCKIVVNR